MKNLQVLIQDYINVVKTNEVWLKEEIGNVHSQPHKSKAQLKELLLRSRHQKKKIEEMILDLKHLSHLCESVNIDSKKVFIVDEEDLTKTAK